MTDAPRRADAAGLSIPKRSAAYVFVKNGKKLASFLKRFQRERDEENEAFAAERQSLIDRINDIVDAATRIGTS